MWPWIKSAQSLAHYLICEDRASTVGLNQKWSLSLMGHPAMFVDIWVVTLGEEMHSTMKNYPAPNVNSAKVEKVCTTTCQLLYAFFPTTKWMWWTLVERENSEGISEASRTWAELWSIKRSSKRQGRPTEWGHIEVVRQDKSTAPQFQDNRLSPFCSSPTQQEPSDKFQ